MAWVSARHINAPLAAHLFAICTTIFDRCFYFHKILQPSGDTPLAAVGVEFYQDLVSDEHFNAM